MFTYFNCQKERTLFSAISRLVVCVLSLSLIFTPSTVYAQSVLNLPLPGSMISMSPAFTPAIIKGVNIHPEDPLTFDFIIDTGSTHLSEDDFKSESEKLIKYFLASLTVSEDEMWVNLSPYEKDRIIPQQFGKTEMGRDLLAQDYMLKQLTASLMYPDEQLGNEFWKRVYSKAQERFGTTEIPMNTFNKIWIVPERAKVYEHNKGAFIVISHLKVMLEEDYLALESNTGSNKHGLGDLTKDDIEIVSGVSAEVVREVLIPEIEREVNEGKTFANLRQIYNSMILASWYKENLKESILGKIYINQNKTAGVDTQDNQINEKIYNQYVEAFKSGVFNFIREDYDEATQEIIPRKYFSGGVVLDGRRESVGGIDETSRAEGSLRVVTSGLQGIRRGANGENENLAFKFGNVLHREEEGEGSVNGTIRQAFEQGKVAELSPEIRTALKEYFARRQADIQAAIFQKGVELDEIESLINDDEVKIYLVEDVNQGSPAIVYRTDDDFQVGHVGVRNKAVYLGKGLMDYLLEGFQGDESYQRVRREYTHALVLRELAGLAKALKVYNGSNYDEAVSQGEQFASDMEKGLMGDKIEKFVKQSVKEFSFLRSDDIDSVLEAINRLPRNPVSDERAHSLYQGALGAMFSATVGENPRSRAPGNDSKYTWTYQAEFAGELLQHPATFAKGVELLEQTYRRGLEIDNRHDADGFEVNQRLSILGEVTKQMARHPELRQQAVDIIFSPSTYGYDEKVGDKGFKEAREQFIGPDRQLTAGEVSDEVPETKPTSLIGSLVSRVKDGLKRRDSTVPMVRKKPTIRDTGTLSAMRNMIMNVVIQIGDSNVELSERLLDVYGELGRWEKTATEAGGHKYYSYPSQDIDKLVQYKGLLPKLEEMADSVEDEESKDNAYLTLFRNYADNGQFSEAIDMFSRSTRTTHAISNGALAKIGADSNYRKDLLNHVRRIGSEQEVESLVVVADATWESGEQREAEKIYEEAWKKSKKQGTGRLLDKFRNHNRNIAEHFIEVARKTGMQFDGMGESELLETVRQISLDELGAYDAHASGEHWITWFVDKVVFELTKSGLYEKAEKLVLLIDRKARIERWGEAQARSMRPEERDKGYKQMAVGAAHRQDYERIDEYLKKMVEFKPDAMLEITKVLGAKGDFENSFIASVLGAVQIDDRGGISRDKDDIGVSTRVLFMDKGESLFELGAAMLEHGGDAEVAQRVFKKAAEVGMGDTLLRKFVRTARSHSELRPIVLDVLENALARNSSIISHHQHAAILGSLIEVFPDLLEGSFPTLPSQGSSSPIANTLKNEEFTKGGIDLNATILDLEVEKEGNGLVLPIGEQSIINMQFDGFLPIIINVSPVMNLPMLLGESENKEDSLELSLNY